MKYIKTFEDFINESNSYNANFSKLSGKLGNVFGEDATKAIDVIMKYWKGKKQKLNGDTISNFLKDAKNDIKLTNNVVSELDFKKK